MEIMEVSKGFIENQTEEFEEIDNEGNKKEIHPDGKLPNQIGKIGKKHEDIANAVNVLNSYQFEI